MRGMRFQFLQHNRPRARLLLCLLLTFSQLLTQHTWLPAQDGILVRPAPRARAERSPAALSQPAPLVAPQAAAVQDAWWRIDFDGQQVGYERLTSARLPQSDAAPPGTAAAAASAANAASVGGLRRTRDTRISLKRLGTSLKLSALLETQETANGVLQQWSLRRTSGDGSSIERTGVWLPADTVYEITERVQATRRTTRLPATQQPRSPVISEWAFAEAVGGARRFRRAVLFPETAAVVDVDFELAGQQSLRLSDGRTITVTRLHFWPTTDPALRTSLYVSAEGQVLRSEQPLLGGTLTLERTDAATALGAADLAALDLDVASLIPLSRPITDPAHRSQTRLKLTMPSGEPLQLPEATFQKVEVVSASQLVVTLQRPVLPADSASISATTPVRVSPEYLSRSRWMTLDDSQVQHLAHAAAGGTTVPTECCRRMARYLRTQLQRSPFSTTLQSAAETARARRGDCTEHAVLLAAMLRVYQIPSRVVAGFLYSERVGGFTSHMWTEAWIEGQWLPFDSTMAVDGNSAVCIKVLDSALTDDVSSGTLLFLPLLQMLGRVRIEVLPESGF